MLQYDVSPTDTAAILLLLLQNAGAQRSLPASVLLKKAPDGTGIIAGGPARVVCELAGIKNIRTKSLGSNNKQNVVLATITGLSQLKSPEEVAKSRSKSVEEVLA